MKDRVLSTISQEDLSRLRIIDARYEALKLNPNAFSASESEHIVLEHNKVVGDLLLRYNVDQTETWSISPRTGLIVYTD